MRRQIFAALMLATASPALAQTVSFSGTQMNDTPRALPSSLCAGGQVLVSFSPETAVSTGSSNFGSFASSQQHCLTPPPNVYADGAWTYAFAVGDTLFGSYSGVLTPSAVAGVLDNRIALIVAGGTGRFLGATGSIDGVGTLDVRPARSVSMLALNGELTIPAVPEPATWAMMILGFGAVGAMLRRRSRTAEAANGRDRSAALGT